MKERKMNEGRMGKVVRKRVCEEDEKERKEKIEKQRKKWPGEEKEEKR